MLNDPSRASCARWEMTYDTYCHRPTPITVSFSLPQEPCKVGTFPCVSLSDQIACSGLSSCTKKEGESEDSPSRVPPSLSCLLQCGAGCRRSSARQCVADHARLIAEESALTGRADHGRHGRDRIEVDQARCVNRTRSIGEPIAALDAAGQNVIDDVRPGHAKCSRIQFGQRRRVADVRAT